ncbi:MAG: virulence protein [Clostridia bacterium]|nr:virulence protein [Clostridia bacterium]
MTVTYAKIKFNVTGTKRKELVSLISRFTGCDAKYKGAPSFAYEVDYFTIDKNGTLIFDDRADSEVIERLLEMLYDNGFIAENDETEQEPQADETGLTIEIPRDKVDYNKFIKQLQVKKSLIKQALEVDDIVIPHTQDNISFRWFNNVEPRIAKAYDEFLSALYKFTNKQTRINSTEAKSENKKYAFRCFLLRLGFIGSEYKETRKILLRNLEGSSAFKNGRTSEVTEND